MLSIVMEKNQFLIIIFSLVIWEVCSFTSNVRNIDIVLFCNLFFSMYLKENKYEYT